MSSGDFENFISLLACVCSQLDCHDVHWTFNDSQCRRTHQCLDQLWNAIFTQPQSTCSCDRLSAVLIWLNVEQCMEGNTPHSRNVLSQIK